MTYRPLLGVLLLFCSAACRPARSPDEIARDKDGDGIANAVDWCPEKRERVNEHNDEDGCPDHLKSNASLWVPGLVVTGLSVPLVIMGAAWAAAGLAPADHGVDPYMNAGMETIGIPLLIAAAFHQAIGIPLIVVGARDTYWSDAPSEGGPPGAPPPVRVELGARGVGVRY
jgi:hypothetical protein